AAPFGEASSWSGPLSLRCVEDRVRRAERDVEHLARGLARGRRLQLAADIERELRHHREAQAETDIVRGERLLHAGALELRVADADEGVEHRRGPEREHGV